MLYGDQLRKIIKEHPDLFVFPSFLLEPKSETISAEYQAIYVNKYKYDAFGCLWRTRIEGYIGEVVKRPLSDWAKLREFTLPDPEIGIPTESGEPKPIITWDEIRKDVEEAEKRGDLVVARMPHGFLFQRLYYLRVLSKLLIDMYKNEPKLMELIDQLTEYWISIVKIYKN